MPMDSSAGYIPLDGSSHGGCWGQRSSLERILILIVSFLVLIAIALIFALAYKKCEDSNITTVSPTNATTVSPTSPISPNTTTPAHTTTPTNATKSTPLPPKTTNATKSTSLPPKTTNATKSTSLPTKTTNATKSTPLPTKTTNATKSTSLPTKTTNASLNTAPLSIKITPFPLYTTPLPTKAANASLNTTPSNLVLKEPVSKMVNLSAVDAETKILKNSTKNTTQVIPEKEGLPTH